jgi:2-methylisocitrate lyase-like PEP mutase family enzyme
VRSIVEATPLPVSADLENGFGDSPKALAQTIQLAGLAALTGASIEQQPDLLVRLGGREVQHFHHPGQRA